MIRAGLALLLALVVPAQGVLACCLVHDAAIRAPAEDAHGGHGSADPVAGDRPGDGERLFPATPAAPCPAAASSALRTAEAERAPAKDARALAAPAAVLGTHRKPPGPAPRIRPPVRPPGAVLAPLPLRI